MKRTLNIYKPPGMTPLEAVKAFQKKNPAYKDIRISYAGRLDPLAEGVLLVLTGAELKKQKKYWELDKEYEADILLGIYTDTYDVLGLPQAQLRSESSSRRSSETPALNSLLQEFQGEYTFSFPPYSSRRIKGKPLFWWARNDRLDEIEIPQKTVQIYKVELVDKKEIQKEELSRQVVEKVNSVQGDFRQEDIKKAWKNILSDSKEDTFTVLKIKVRCSSGTYIRSIADDIGKKLETGAVLLHLKRTRVGKYKGKNSLII